MYQSKFHRPFYHSLYQALSQCFQQGYYADKVLEKLFKQSKKMGQRDRNFVASYFYDVVRWWSRLKYSCELHSVRDEDLSEIQIFNIIELWLAIHEPKSLPGFFQTPEDKMLKYIKRWDKVSEPWIEYSVPEWLWIELTNTIENKKVFSYLQSINQMAPLFIRVNRLKITKQLLIDHFRQLDWDPIENTSYPEDCIGFKERKNVFKTELFQSGFFEVQDGGSQQIVPLLAVKPGEKIIDACAGAGGKSLHLASLMNNKGKIISMDIHEWKLKELKKRAKRAGVDIIETKVIESTKVIKRLHAKADALLLDVPCTGLGVLRRNPDSKWKLTSERLVELLAIQKDILNRYSHMVKPGGRMVYATCSILPCENEKQVESFVKDHPEWIVKKQVWVDPSKTEFDGFYSCLLEKQQS